MKQLIRTGTCSRCTDPSCCEGCLNFISPNICAIYNERPKDRGCILWPPHPFERPNNCTFHFFDKDTGEEINGWKNKTLLDIYEPVNEEC